MLPPAPVSAPAAIVQPLAPARYKVQFTASAELRERLERLRALMRSSVPDGDLAEVDYGQKTMAERRRPQRVSASRRPPDRSEASP